MSDRRRLGHVLRRRRRLRAGVVQLIYVAVALALGLVTHDVGTGFTVPSGRAAEMLIAIATGMVAFIGIVYSLLFLVVQFGATSFTPRLTLFRDAPIIWHSFGLFTAVIVYSFTAALVVAGDEQVSGLVPVVAAVGVLASLILYRRLQTGAFRSIQLSSVLDEVSRRGREVIDGLYLDPMPVRGVGRDAGQRPRPATHGDADVDRELRWPGRAAILQAIDVRRVVEAAEHANAVVTFRVGAGDMIQEHEALATVPAGSSINEDEVRRGLSFGHERTFEQDPQLALRVLADIALRAVSPAINDPTTAVQALDCTESLLRALATRNRDIQRIEGANGVVRVVLVLPTWDDYVSVALDEIVCLPGLSPNVRRRLFALIDDLLLIVPGARAEPLLLRRPLLDPTAPPAA